MFDIPDAKRVRRADLHTHSRSQSPTPTNPKEDAELQQALQARLAALYGPLEPLSLPPRTDSASQRDPSPEQQEDQENEFEFRLFSTAPSTSTSHDPPSIQKILLHDEDEDEDVVREGRFLRPRPRTYYFRPAATGEVKAQYVFAAISGDVVLQQAKTRAWGLEVPWRVKRIIVSTKIKSRVSTTSTPEVSETNEEAEKPKRTKPNKKRRLILRERERLKKAKQDEKKKMESEKEEKEREKRTRRNREKKVKRKMKEKAKKLEVGVGAGEVVEGAEGAREGSGEDVEMGSDGD